MRCRKTHKLMSSHLDGRLPAGEKAALETHLGRCEACAARLHGLQATRQLVAGLERFEAPVGFSRRLMAQLDPAPRPRPLLPLLFARCAQMAVVLLVVGVGVVFGRLVDTSMGAAPAAEDVPFLSLALFGPAPADSLGGAYLMMTEGGHE